MADTRLKDRSLFDPEIMRPAIWESFRKLAPQHVIKNPVMDSGALFIAAGQRAKGVEQAEKNRPIFEAELKVQEGNITEAGEKEFTAGLRYAWTDYQAKFGRLEKSASAEEAKQLYFDALEAAFYKVKSAADEILTINQDTMTRTTPVRSARLNRSKASSMVLR